MNLLLTANNPHVGLFTRRPSPAPATPVALGARSVMWRQFLPGEVEDSAIRPWVKLLWVVNGIGAVRIEGRVLDLSPGQAALFLPGMRHEAWVPSEASEPWELRWCTLDGPLCVEITRALGLVRAGVWYAGDAPTQDFERLHEAIAASVTPEGERLADVAAYSLMARAAQLAPLPPVDLVVDQAVDLIQERWAETDFGVEVLARLLGLHRSDLSRRFSTRTGLPPSVYLRNLRMQNALSLLSTTSLSVAEIARRCGFEDADYFTRMFHRVQGVSPGAFRRDHGG